MKDGEPALLRFCGSTQLSSRLSNVELNSEMADRSTSSPPSASMSKGPEILVSESGECATSQVMVIEVSEKRTMLSIRILCYLKAVDYSIINSVRTVVRRGVRSTPLRRFSCLHSWRETCLNAEFQDACR